MGEEELQLTEVNRRSTRSNTTGHCGLITRVVGRGKLRGDRRSGRCIRLERSRTSGGTGKREKERERVKKDDGGGRMYTYIHARIYI